MNTDTIYRGIRYFGIGLIFVSLAWAFYKGAGSEAHPGGLPSVLQWGFIPINLMKKLCLIMKPVSENTRISSTHKGAEPGR